MVDTYTRLFVLITSACDSDDSEGGLIWIAASAALLVAWAVLVTGFAVYEARAKAPAPKQEGHHE